MEGEKDNFIVLFISNNILRRVPVSFRKVFYVMCQLKYPVT